MVSSWMLVSMLVWASPEVAACPLIIDGEPSRAWLEAARALPELRATDTDCARVHLQLDEHGARLTYTTREGRDAVRRLTDPEELSTTLAALAERAPVASAPASAAEETAGGAAARSAQRSPDASQSSSHHAANEGAREVHALPLRDAEAMTRSTPQAAAALETTPGTEALFAIHAGLRGGQNGLMSPVLRGAISLHAGALELGVAASWDLRYARISNAEEAPARTIAGGVFAAWREPAGDVALLAGGQLSLAVWTDNHAIRPELHLVDVSGRTIEITENGAEARAGIWAGAVWPRTATIRMRAELSADVVPRATRRSDVRMVSPLVPPDPQAPNTPGWAFGATLGVEVGSP